MKRLLIFVFFVLMFITLPGCLDSPSAYEAQRLTLDTYVDSATGDECSCVLCTMSTGSSWTAKLADKFIINTLGSGACWVANGTECSRFNIAKFVSEDDEFNFVRAMGFGLGDEFISFTRAQSLMDNRLDYAPRLVYSMYRFPYYDTEGWVEGWDSDEADVIDCIMDGGATPIYFMDFDVPYSLYLDKRTVGEINSRGKSLSFDPTDREKEIYDFINSKVGDYIDNLDLDRHPAAIIVPSAEFTLQETPYVSDLVLKFSNFQKEGGESYWFSNERPMNIGLMPCQTNPITYGNFNEDDPLFVILDRFKEDYPESFKKVSYVFNELFINEEDYSCDVDLAVMNAIMRSKYILYYYGKPTFLVITISEKCVKDEGDAEAIALSIARNTDFMRQYGIVGVIFPIYSSSGMFSSNFERDRLAFQPVPNSTKDYCLNPLEHLDDDEYKDYFDEKMVSLDNNDGPASANMKAALSRALYWYYDKGYNGLIFDSDGMNVSGFCDYLGNPSALTLTWDDLSKYIPKCYNTYSSWDSIVHGCYDFGLKLDITSSYIISSLKFSDSYSNCWTENNYIPCGEMQDSMSTAYIASIDPRIITVLKRNTGSFDPGLWYSVQNDLLRVGWISENNLKSNTKDSNLVAATAMLYVLKSFTSSNTDLRNFYYDLLVGKYSTRDFDPNAFFDYKIDSIYRLYNICYCTLPMGNKIPVGARNPIRSACQALNEIYVYQNDCSILGVKKMTGGSDNSKPDIDAIRRNNLRQISGNC